jgi:hypothetical protein
MSHNGTATEVITGRSFDNQRSLPWMILNVCPLATDNAAASKLDLLLRDRTNEYPDAQ